MRRRDFLGTGAAAVLLVAGGAVDGEARETAGAAHRIGAHSRLLFVSGQVPTDANGEAPAQFSEQCRLAWRNLETQLNAADMQLRHLVKLTVFLARAEDRRREREVRRAMLGRIAQPSVSVVVTGIYDEAWRIEIEAIALA
ncbi:RidA family protein [Lysobacter sp. K5869]|uniref:RidA family protein n=1 Tax=Lysobacter sp. K5869 TaxID=2820808 RepID=UPI001C0621BD|nr:RidA family protein [Lysobacter sp. K5869]QWP78225.1 RidA family protein [Lysobacter sp. K5869]